MKKIKRLDPRLYKPILDPLYFDRMTMRLLREPSFKLCFKRDVSHKFFTMMEDLYDKKRIFRTNTILQVSGLTGTGKSISCLTIGKKFCNNFKEENIKFFDQQIIQLLKKGELQDTIVIRDENPSKGVKGLGSNRIDSQIDVIGDTTRKKGLSLIFIEPEFKRNDIAKWYLETIDMGVIEQEGVTYRVNRIGVKEPSTLMYIGSIYLHILDDEDPDWVAYNERKDIFIDGVLDENYHGAKMDYNKVAEELMETMDLNIYKNKKEKKLFVLKKYPNLTLGEIDMILTAMIIIEREKYM